MTTALGTIWLLVVMGASGDLKVIDVLPNQAACTARLARSPADSDGMCMPVIASASTSKR
jgi:hypothetical protein